MGGNNVNSINGSKAMPIGANKSRGPRLEQKRLALSVKAKKKLATKDKAGSGGWAMGARGKKKTKGKSVPQELTKKKNGCLKLTEQGIAQHNKRRSPAVPGVS